MIRLKPELPLQASQPCVVVAMTYTELNLLIQLLHHPMIEAVQPKGKTFDRHAVNKFRYMAHELER